jgi:superfamily II DNA/RNA helicase|eukprot:jgi/Chrpa1/15189/Chrysochromulina_OHIO_Genome00005389-RA
MATCGFLRAASLRARVRELSAVAAALPAAVPLRPPAPRQQAKRATSFEAIGLTPELAAAVRALGFVKPSDPQVLAVPALLAGESVAFASSTGSGKTLAYLLPTMQALRQQELSAPSLGRQSGERAKARPRALVLAPTRELAAQIGAVAKALSQHIRLRVRTAEGGTTLRETILKLENGADLVVATPARLLLLHQRGAVSLREVRHVIIDEADDMLLRGFDESMRDVLRRCPPRTGEPPSPQLAFVSATLGKAVQHVIQREYPDVRALIAACAHRTPPTLTHQLRRYTGRDKLIELHETLLTIHGGVTHDSVHDSAGGAAAAAGIGDLGGFRERAGGRGGVGGGGGAGARGGRAAPGWEDAAEGTEDEVDVAPRPVSRSRTLVFCRGVQSARAVLHSLAEAGLAVGGCHGKMPEAARRADLAAFVLEPPTRPLLVCTDLAARGIDFPQVETVLNFDFPATSSLYLHRAGRAGRMGRTGTVLSLVHDSEHRLAASVLDAVNRRTEVHTVRKGDFRARTSSAVRSTSRAGARALIGQAAATGRRLAAARGARIPGSRRTR